MPVKSEEIQTTYTTQDTKTIGGRVSITCDRCGTLRLPVLEESNPNLKHGPGVSLKYEVEEKARKAAALDGWFFFWVAVRAKETNGERQMLTLDDGTVLCPNCKDHIYLSALLKSMIIPLIPPKDEATAPRGGWF